MGSRDDRVVAELVARHGRNFAAEAGIRMGDTPSPLFRLLCLSLLLSARIRSGIAVAAARALTEAGWTSAARMVGSTWAERVRVLNGAGYARYDEKTARMLGDTAVLLLERHHGDLRRLRAEAAWDPPTERRLLRQFPGIGEVGAAIFAREVQAVWTEVFPFADRRALAVAENLGLPADARALARRAGEPEEFTTLVAALVRCGLAHDGPAILEAAGGP